MDKLKIVLIDSNTNWMSKKSDIAGQVVLPLGLMYLSSFLKREYGDKLKIKIINTVIDIENIADLINQLNLFKPDIVGIRALSTNKFFFEDILRNIKLNYPKTLIFVGGPHAACQPEEVLKLKEINAIIIGEGELTFAELIGRILGKKDYHNIDGIAYMKNDEIVINNPRQLVDNLDNLPVPDYSAIDVDRYKQVLNYGYTLRKQAVILTSRGCPFSCAYCFKFFNQQYRKRSPKNVLSEIVYLINQFGIKDFFVVDDNFNIDRKRAAELLQLIIKNNLNINLYFTSGLRGDLLDKELIDLMVRAGTIWITFGVETVNPRLQKLVNRVYDVARMRKNIIYAASKKIMTGLFFMIGFPTETKAESMDTINFVKELDCVTMPFIFGVRYFPATPMTKYALENNYIRKEIINNIYKYYHDFNFLETSTMTNLDFKEIFFIFLKEIFLNKKRLNNAFDLQEKFLNPKEVAMLYSLFFSKKIEQPRLFFENYVAKL